MVHVYAIKKSVQQDWVLLLLLGSPHSRLGTTIIIIGSLDESARIKLHHKQIHALVQTSWGG